MMDMTGVLLQASCKAFQLEAGLQGNIIDLPEAAYSYVTPTWVMQIWKSCQRHQIQILGDHWDYSPLRQHDVELMRLFIRAGYQTTDLNTLNRCRMYLQVIFLSEICEATGNKMEQYLWKQPQVTKSAFCWPKIPKPTPTEWRLWQQALQWATSMGQNLMLPLLLGKWHHQKEHSPGWYYHISENALYYRTPEGYTCHGMYPRWSQTQLFHWRGKAAPETPDWLDLHIASVTLQGEKIALTGIGTSAGIVQMTLLNWVQKLEQMPLGMEWQLSISYRGSLDNIRCAIDTNTALAVSDSSFQDQCGACAWIIEGETSEDHIKGSMNTPGQKQDHSSFRSKAAGIYGAL